MRLSFFFGLALALTACGDENKRVNDAGKLWEEFSGETALRHVERMVELGPRPVGSEALERSRLYLIDALTSAGWTVTRQTFNESTPRGPMTFVNLIATFGKAKKEEPPSFLLCSHYDTKFFGTETFVGANDGGSNTGLLVEMARVLATQAALAARVQLVFFDGEEAFVAFTETDGFFGSRYFAQQLVAEGKAKQFHGGILFDMVGDRNLTITLPPDSPSHLAAGIFAAAEAQGVRHRFTYAAGNILDDHTQLNAIGIPVIDLIDFDYAPWHTPEDTMDKISAASLETVGRVALRFLAEGAFK
ncbi:MAG: M28 family peptidase [Chthoniobacterales bacterium]